ncbi:MAG: dihydroneopterin aldolase [Leptolyngbyaceae cyanobacterium SL_7_1]|nr:dihydroneopterin aldolase [Leptolyngbyaceae cyanobacterium SL_7_1]
MTQDCLHIQGIRAYGYTGFLPEEQRLGQWFEVSLSLWLDLSIAGASDRLADTYDYSDIVQSIQTLIQTSKFALIEKLAEAIAQLALSGGGVDQVRVQLVKVAPPIANFDGRIVIDLTRSIADFQDR